MDPMTGEVFYSNNALDEVPMASTTKIMTAIVAMTFGKPDQKITIGQDAVKEQNGENSVADLTRGDVLTLKDLLYALLLPSGDDAAVAIADGIAGSEASFVRMMNMEAALLGLDHTHYTNVHGLDAAGHYTTVGDLARIGRIAVQNFPLFAQIVKTPTYVVRTVLHGQYTWHTTNELLTPSHDYQGAIGIKTGHTGNAGYCLVFAASRNGATLIGVLLGEQDQSGEQRFYDATALLNWGFAREKTITNMMNAIAGKP
jgi:D-alanyl-D-alanine carboxypeptidase (penicillin-binding protein 5/6)